MYKYKSKLVTEFIKPRKVMKVVGFFKNHKSLLINQETQIYINELNVFEIHGGGFIVLDFGKELQGGLRILSSRFDNSFNADVRIRFGESVDECFAELGEKNSTNEHSIRDMVVSLSSYSDQEFGKTGFRFVRIDFLNQNIVYRFTNIYAKYIHTSDKIKGKFKSDDKLLNQVFDVAARTLYLNCQENLLEGIKRDRLVWVGDLQPEVLGITYLFGKSDLVYKALYDSIRKNPLPAWFGSIPAYSMWLIQIVYDYYLKNNNVDDVLNVIDYINGVLRQIDSCVNDNGDIDISKVNTNPKGWLFLDWPSSDSDEVLEGNRFVFINTICTYKKLCSDIGTKAIPLADSILKKLNAAPLKDVKHKQVVALGYFAGRINKQEAREKLLKNGVSDISIYLSYYIFKAIGEVAGNQVAVNMMKEYYGAMLSRGATTFWENFDIDMLEGSGSIDKLTPKNKLSIHGDFGKYCYVGYRLSLCHGWSCSPIQFVFENIVGFKILKPGCKQVMIEPDLGDLHEINAKIPTPFGVLRLHIHNDNNKVIVEHNELKGMEIIVVEKEAKKR